MQTIPLHEPGRGPSSMSGTVIVDYGVGNIGSVANMLRKIGETPTLSCDPDVVDSAERIVLPGVGAFDACMSSLSRPPGLIAAIRRATERRVPLLGICVGMQMLAESSAEGDMPGLGLIPGRVLSFLQDDTFRLTVPHMNWCVLDVTRPSPLFPSGSTERFYFVHSYHFHCTNPENSVATARHGIDFTAAVQMNNIFGVQFHPEKSHKFGFELFRRFIAIRTT